MAHVFPFEGRAPTIGRDVWLAPTATIIGHATIGDESSVWFGAVLRADTLAIVVGSRTNIQDNAVVHITNENPLEGVDAHGTRIGTRIGDEVTVGHGAIVHACTIGNRVLVGMGSVILDGAVIGNDVLIAAGTVVTPGSKIPDGVVVMGSPGKIKGPLRESDRFWSHQASEMYVGYAARFRKSGL